MDKKVEINVSYMRIVQTFFLAKRYEFSNWSKHVGASVNAILIEVTWDYLHTSVLVKITFNHL